MQRCQECGFSASKVGSTHCDKCGTAFAAPQQNLNSLLVNNQDGKRTIKGGVANLPPWDAPNISPVVSNQGECFKCGYPLLDISEDCPNCGTNNAIKQEGPHLIKPQKQPIANMPVGGTMKISDFGFNFGNVDPKMQLVSERDGKVYEFEGTDIIVNRDALGKNNNSISSNVHARFEQIDGVWHIADESSNQATFIQVVGKTPILEGTIVLIGNQFFRFKNAE
jgi:hypothetical protein